MATKTFIKGLKDEKEKTLAAFINTDETGEQGQAQAKPATKTRKRGEKKERFNMFITPEAKENLSKIAYMQRRSSADVVHELIEKHIALHQELIDKYNSIFQEDKEE